MALAVHNVEVVYEDVMLVVTGASIQVPHNRIVALLGSNGAGKTSLLRAMTGLLNVHRGKITRGHVSIDGSQIDTKHAPDVVRAGVSQVMEGRRIFVEFTVEENLKVGAFRRKDKVGILADVEQIYTLFPRLRERFRQKAGSLSGGEQQMLAVGRALMLKPRVMLLDEPSLGLAPVIIDSLFGALSRINKELGTAMLIVEQNANLALNIADHAYVLETGSIVVSGPAAEVAAQDSVRAAYLGI